MTDAKIGRVLVASMHQAIADELPTRLEFYEHWLNESGLRDGTIGQAPMLAVLSFLRQDADGYDRVVARAGALAARWRIADLSRLRQGSIARLPMRLRARAALRVTRSLVRDTFSASAGRVRLRRGRGEIAISHSPFCDVRTTVESPLCGFYAAAVATLLGHFEVDAGARAIACRAVGATECVVAVEDLVESPAPTPPSLTEPAA